MTPVLSIESPELNRVSLGCRKGKVREVFDLGNSYLIVSSDRISAFDVVMANGIPDKGKVLNQLSAYWFDRLGDVCSNHVITTSDDAISQRLGFFDPALAGRSTLAKKANPLAIECVVRGYLAGSMAKEYRAAPVIGGTRTIHGVAVPDGLVEGEQLPEPIFTPATKAEEGHDENISFARACDIVGVEIANKVRDLSLQIFRLAGERAKEVGLILADTKFEFGTTESGLIWIDEALTPDSSRYWEASTYEPGGSQPGFDKQFVRDYLESSGWDKTPPGPTLPDSVVEQTRAKYLTACERITGRACRL